MSSFVRKALSATIATALLGAAAIAFTPATASAQAILAKSECIDGFWHVISYDPANPSVILSDERTAQPCGGQALALNIFSHIGRGLSWDGRGDFGRDIHRGGDQEHFTGIQARSGRE